MRLSASADGPVVTIGILTCNARRYVQRTIPAILSWIGGEDEVLVFDNGSTDGTVEYLRQFPQIRIVGKDHNSGYGSGKNALVAEARGRYVLLLDDDVLVEDEGVLTKCRAFVESRPAVAFVSVPLLEEGLARTPHYGLFFAQRKTDRSLQELQSQPSFPVGGFVGGLTLCRRSAFERLGGYEPIYPCQDYDLCARAHLQGWQIHTITTAHAVHLGTDRRAAVDHWIAWHEYQLCGFLRTILKNYTLSGVVLWGPLAALWIFWKTLRKYSATRNRQVLGAYMRSVQRFCRDLPDTLDERARVQSSRVIRRDTFRRIRFTLKTATP